MTAEIALAVLLLTSSGLVIKAITEILDAELGFDPTHMLTAQISLSSARYREATKQSGFFDSVIQQLASGSGSASCCHPASFDENS